MANELRLIQPSVLNNIHKILKSYSSKVYVGSFHGIRPDITVVSDQLKTIYIIECKDGKDRGIAVQVLEYRDRIKEMLPDYSVYTIIINTESKDLKSFDRSNEVDIFYLFQFVSKAEFKLIDLVSGEELGPFSVKHKEKVEEHLRSFELDPTVHTIKGLLPKIRDDLWIKLADADLGIRVDWLDPKKNFHEFLTGKKSPKFGEPKVTKENSIGEMNLMAGSIKNLNKIIANFPYLNGLERKMALHYCKNMNDDCDLWSIEPVQHYFSPFIHLRECTFQNNEKLNLPFIQEIYFSFEMFKSFKILKQPLGFVHYVKHPTSKIILHDLDAEKDDPVSLDRGSYSYYINGMDCESLFLKIWKFKRKIADTTKDFLTTPGGFSTRGKDPLQFPFKKWNKYLGKLNVPFKYEYMSLVDQPTTTDTHKKGGSPQYDIWRPIPPDREQDVQTCLNHPLTKFLHKIQFFAGSNYVDAQIPIIVPPDLFTKEELELMSVKDFYIGHPGFRFSKGM